MRSCEVCLTSTQVARSLNPLLDLRERKESGADASDGTLLFSG